MTYRMLLERPDFFAAAGIVAGAVSSDDAYPHPKSPMPLIIFHGVKDETVPYEDSGDAIRFWSAINGCPATPTERAKDGNVYGDGCMPQNCPVIRILFVTRWPTATTCGLAATSCPARISNRCRISPPPI